MQKAMNCRRFGVLVGRALTPCVEGRG